MTTTFYCTGYCLHPACIAKRGGGLKPVRFPAMSAHIRHNGGRLLFDTGYAPRFFDATRRFPEKLYAWTTPVTLNRTPLAKQLEARGESADTLFLSHLHGDHIGGLLDFPQAKIICSREAYAFAAGSSSRFAKVCRGVLTALLPQDFTERTTFIEDLPQVALPDEMQPFTHGYRISDSLTAVALPGHAAGHYGLWTGEFFLIGDAVWHLDTVSHNRRPHPLAALVMDDRRAYQQTIDALQILYHRNPHTQLVPSHCSETLKRLGLNID